jgi:hypothetical protein
VAERRVERVSGYRQIDVQPDRVLRHLASFKLATLCMRQSGALSEYCHAYPPSAKFFAGGKLRETAHGTRPRTVPCGRIPGSELPRDSASSAAGRPGSVPCSLTADSDLSDQSVYWHQGHPPTVPALIVAIGHAIASDARSNRIRVRICASSNLFATDGSWTDTGITDGIFPQSGRLIRKDAVSCRVRDGVRACRSATACASPYA